MSKEKEIKMHDCLDTINADRAFICSAILAVIIPILMLVVWQSGIFDEHEQMILILATGIEVCQLLFTILLKILIKKERITKYKMVSTAYFAITIMAIMAVSAYDMAEMRSQLVYVAACVFFIFVPVFDEKTRLIFIIGQTVVMMWLMLYVQLDTRCIVDMCIVQLATVFISRYQHNVTVRTEVMIDNLKEKTIHSEKDALTGLYNRHGFDIRTEIIWPFCQRRNDSAAIIKVDIDNFKKYNNKYGHIQGDRCIKAIAEVLKEAARRETDVIARTSGEEYDIFIQDIEDDNAIKIAKRIQEGLTSLVIVDENGSEDIENDVTVSIGIAIKETKREAKLNELQEIATKSLACAKKNGSNSLACNENIV